MLKDLESQSYFNKVLKIVLERKFASFKIKISSSMWKAPIIEADYFIYSRLPIRIKLYYKISFLLGKMM